MKAIILIGPACAGKTTIGKMLSEYLKKPVISLDDIAIKYYQESGFFKEDFTAIENRSGYLEAYKAWEEHRCYAVKRLLLEYPGGILDLGAGHTHYINKQFSSEIAAQLASFKNVFLILPSESLEHSLAILRERNQRIRSKTWIYDNYDLLSHWVNDEDNYLIAKKTVYTTNKSTSQICREIISDINDA